MANPAGENGNQMFVQESAYGDMQRTQGMAEAAPIVGAPIPGQHTNSRPTGPAQPVATAGPMADPFVQVPKGLAFYKAQAKTWAQLAAHPGASAQVQEHAVAAKAYYSKVKRGLV